MKDFTGDWLSFAGNFLRGKARRDCILEQNVVPLRRNQEQGFGAGSLLV